MIMETLKFYSDSHEKTELLKAAAKALQISFEINKEPNNPEFVDKIEERREQFDNGQDKMIAIEDLWK